ncbi:hypothetical protein [Brevundimonas bacteroides]|uniref:hypothetical protein n=1 Tax=Brevundimonas bacteroides TaxID=74311 RepID=UPI000496191E|nr:hypothetical protein [Brevundimonas bacteroides]
MATVTVQLLVRSARSEDVYKDVIRIAEADRSGLRTGRIHKIRTGGSHAYAVLRGLGKAEGKILLDEAVRQRLGVTYGQTHEFKLNEAGFLDQLGWGWNATDPTYSSATKLGVLSFWLGLISLVLSVGAILFGAFSAT